MGEPKSLSGIVHMKQEGLDTVFLLWHMREHIDGTEDNKLIGVYDSAEEAQMAQLRVKDKPGFKDYPDGFLIDKACLNKDEWTEGFAVED